MCIVLFIVFFFQAEDGIRDLVRSRGLGDVYKRQIDGIPNACNRLFGGCDHNFPRNGQLQRIDRTGNSTTYGGPCLLYTSDAADERSSVDLGGRRIIKKKKKETQVR